MRRKKKGLLEISDIDFQNPVTFPYQNSELHKGFVSSKNNSFGLQADFYFTFPNSASCKWPRPAAHFQGFPGIIHGGVLVALADELMANCIVANLKRIGVSLSMSTKWFRPLLVDDAIIGKAIITARIGNFVLISSDIMNKSGKLAVTSQSIFFLPNVEQFERMTKTKLPLEMREYLGANKL